MKKLTVLLVVVAMSCFAMAAGAADVTIRLASAFEPTHILCQSAEQFKKMVEERSGGAIAVELFLGGVMGSEEEVTESVSIGAVEMQAGGGLPIKTYAPQYYFLDSLAHVRINRMSDICVQFHPAFDILHGPVLQRQVEVVEGGMQLCLRQGEVQRIRHLDLGVVLRSRIGHGEHC